MPTLMICKQTGGYINQVVSGEFHFAATFPEKNRPEKFPFIATNSWIILAVRWSVKYFFAPNSPELLKKKRTGEQRKPVNAKRFAF